MKDTGDFLEVIKSLGRIPEDAFLVTADVVSLCPSIPHDSGLKALYEKLEERSDKKLLSVDLVDMAEFVLKNNFFEIEPKVKKQTTTTLVLPQGLNLHQHIHVSSWIKLRLILWKRKL